jgi:MoeA C-terminal region (domain IV)
MADLLEVPLLGLPAAGRPVSAAAAGGGTLSPAADDGGSGAYSGGGFVALSTGGQISSRLLSMRSAAALLELPQVPLPPPPDDFADGFADENLLPNGRQPAHRQRRTSHQRQQNSHQQSWQYDSSCCRQQDRKQAESSAELQQLSAEVLPGQASWLQAEQHVDALWQSLPLDADRLAHGSRTTGSSGGSDADSSTVSSSVSRGQASFVGRMLSAVLLLGHRLAYLL